MSYFEDADYDDLECYSCGELCYWDDGELYDFDVDEPHICKHKIMAVADDFEE